MLQLEQHLAQAREEIYSIRKYLEQVSAPAPSGDLPETTQDKLSKMLNKRRKSFYKQSSQPK
jgi:hypothetical protein